MTLHLIVAGMHRSGTSLTASFIDAIGISMGERLLAADRNNQKGYFEDVEFLEFHRAALTASTRADEAGVHDWGWTVGENLDRENFARFEERARELIAARDGQSDAWGWKDPRTTLMLDFWHRLLPDAKYLLVYRSPWDAAESMMRVGGDYFPAHPDHSLAMWSFYNEALLRFYREHRTQCVLFSIDSLIGEPARLAALVREKLGIQATDETAAGRFGELYSGDLFHALPADHPVVQMVRHFDPRSMDVLRQLESEADLPGGLLPDDAPAADPARLAAWPFFCYRETAEVKGRLRAAEKELARQAKELEERDARLYETGLEIARQEHLIADVTAKADLYWSEKQQLWEEKQALWEEKQALWAEKQELWAGNQRLWAQNQESEAENLQLKAQVTDLHQLYVDLTAQRQDLASQLEGESARRSEGDWRESQLRHERDHLALVVESMRNTTMWKLREKLLRLKPRAGNPAE